MDGVPVCLSLCFLHFHCTIGRGVFTTTSFKKSEFLLQFGWKLLTEEEGDALEEHDSSGYCFFVEGKGKCFW